MRKSTATMVPRDMRLKKLQLVIDEQSPMLIKPDSLIFLVRRKLQENNVLLNHAQTLREWHNATHVPFRDWFPALLQGRSRHSAEVPLHHSSFLSSAGSFQDTALATVHTCGTPLHTDMHVSLMALERWRSWETSFCT